MSLTFLCFENHVLKLKLYFEANTPFDSCWKAFRMQCITMWTFECVLENPVFIACKMLVRTVELNWACNVLKITWENWKIFVMQNIWHLLKNISQAMKNVVDIGNWFGKSCKSIITNFKQQTKKFLCMLVVHNCWN